MRYMLRRILKQIEKIDKNALVLLYPFDIAEHLAKNIHMKNQTETSLQCIIQLFSNWSNITGIETRKVRHRTM